MSVWPTSRFLTCTTCAGASRTRTNGGTGARRAPPTFPSANAVPHSVWILGVEDGILSHPDSTEEDERRLLYVGITRARNRLELSSAMKECKVSQFLYEVGFFGQELKMSKKILHVDVSTLDEDNGQKSEYLRLYQPVGHVSRTGMYHEQALKVR